MSTEGSERRFRSPSLRATAPLSCGTGAPFSCVAADFRALPPFVDTFVLIRDSGRS
jgi:hypothetical protein